MPQHATIRFSPHLQTQNQHCQHDQRIPTSQRIKRYVHCQQHHRLARTNGANATYAPAARTTGKMADFDAGLEEALAASTLEALAREVSAERRTVEDAHFRQAVAASMAEPPPLAREVSHDDGTLHRSDEFDVTPMFGLLSRHGGERIRLFGLQHGVKLLLKHPDGTPVCPKRATTELPHGYCGTSRRHAPVFLVIEGTRTALEVAVPVFQKEVLENPNAWRARVHARWEETAFVFVDNCNIFINAQYPHEGSEREHDIRLSVPKLCDVVRFGRHPKVQVVVGSCSGARAPSWQKPYEKEGFSVHLEEARGGGQQMVDDVIHAQAMAALCKNFGKGRLSQTLVLLTGDGNGNHGRTTFPGIVAEAMKHNAQREANGNEPLWSVEIISWERALSDSMKALRDAYPDYISIRLLDLYRSYVTFRDQQRLTQVADVSRRQSNKGAATKGKGVGAKGKGVGAGAKGKGAGAKGKGNRAVGHCQHGTYCIKFDCPSMHPYYRVRPCQFVSTQAGCTNPDCTFLHPKDYHRGWHARGGADKRGGGRGRGGSGRGGACAAVSHRAEAKLAAALALKTFVTAQGGSLRACELGQPSGPNTPPSFYALFPEHKLVIQRKVRQFCEEFPQYLSFEAASVPAHHTIAVVVQPPVQPPPPPGEVADSALESSSEPPEAVGAEAVSSSTSSDGVEAASSSASSDGGEDTDCIICMEQERSLDICLWPCRHRHFCKDCADELLSQGMDCPVCRATVEEVLVLY